MVKSVFEVVGIKKSKSARTGRDCFTYHLSGEFNDYEKENGNVEGKAVSTEFSYTDYGVHVGDLVELDYVRGYQNQASLSNMTVVGKSNNSFDSKGK